MTTSETIENIRE